ncbi:MAG: tetratricopeptide repeat protein [Deltaproteobacteria bacterium]|nr:tetratricopeptide repeat protein [Deltaproteobacteria bacterium]MBN2846652.1 tetratricopeptide repeat protein [Deltaproteobacteria bacterium]
MAKKVKRDPVEAGYAERILLLTESHTNLIVSIILIATLALRIIALLGLQNTIYFDYLLYDERVYHIWASKIADGTYHSSSVYKFAPLFAYMMAFIYKILSPQVIYIRILNIVFGVGACYLIYLTGKELAGRLVGIAACLVAALYKPFIFYSIVPLKAALSVFLLALTVYLFVAALGKRSMVKLFFMGVALGLMLNVRPQCILVIPLLPVLIGWDDFKNGTPFKSMASNFVVYMLGIAIAVSPFVTRNYIVTGKMALTTSQSGFNLYQSNRIGSGPVPFATTSPFHQGIQFTIEASKRVGRKLTPEEASSYWKEETIKEIKKEPGAFFQKVCKKILSFSQQFQLTDHYNIPFMSQFVPFFKIPFFSFWFIFPLGMAGMGISVLRSARARALSMIFFVYGSTLIIFFTTTRYRLPLLAILIPFAVMGIKDLISAINKRHYFAISFWAVILVFSLILGALPTEKTGDMTAYYNGHAIVLHSKGASDEALLYWEKSSALNKRYSDFANMSLAGLYYFRYKDVKKASFYLDKIDERSYAAANKYELWGEILHNQKRDDEAIAAYKKALSINSGLISPRKKLIEILKKRDREQARQEQRLLMYISSFYTVL